MSAEARLKELGIILPEPMHVPDGFELPFVSVQVRGGFAYLSGHIGQMADGAIMKPLGKVGNEVALDQAVESAKAAGLAMLGSLKREIGSLDRVAGWSSIFGMVNTAPEFSQYSVVINGVSKLILDVFGQDIGAHARSAIGVAGLPFDAPVEVEAIVAIRD